MRMPPAFGRHGRTTSLVGMQRRSKMASQIASVHNAIAIHGI